MSTSKPVPSNPSSFAIKSAAGVGLALAAGATLPEKAEAVIIVNDNDVVSLGYDTGNWSHHIRMVFDPTSNLLTALETSNYAPGWALRNGSQNFYFLRPAGSVTYSNPGRFYFLAATTYTSFGTAATFSEARPDIDLASPPSPYFWSTVGLRGAKPAVGESYFVGLRYLDTGSGDAHYGWAQVEQGSIVHLQSAIQTTANGSITVGQTAGIPEPSRAVLLTMGLAGVTAFRRTRGRKRAQPGAAVESA